MALLSELAFAFVCRLKCLNNRNVQLDASIIQVLEIIARTLTMEFEELIRFSSSFIVEA
jgi:hypothetical protein